MERAIERAGEDGVESSAVFSLHRVTGAFLLDVLGRVEDVSSTSNSTFSTGDGRLVGEVLASEGRVCIVRQAEGRVSLGERIRERHPGLVEALRSALAHAKKEGRLLGDALASLGALPTSVIRLELLDQFADGMSALALSAARGLVERSAGALQPRVQASLCSFQPLEIYWSTVAKIAPPPDPHIGFDELAAASETAALVFSEQRFGAPIVARTHGFSPGSVKELAALGRLVESLARPPALSLAGHAPKLVQLRREHQIVLAVATQEQTALFVGIQPQACAQTVGRLR